MQEQDFPFLFSVDTDTEKREITITLPQGQNQLILPEYLVHPFIKQLEGRSQEWQPENSSGKNLESEIAQLKSRYENLDKRLRRGSSSDWFLLGMLFCNLVAAITRFFI